MRRFRRRRSTATSTRAACAACTTARTPAAERFRPEPRRSGRLPAESRSGAMTARDPDVERFLLSLQARRSPRTVDAYKRDLAALGAFRGGPVADATVDDLERWVAGMRADGLAGSTISRRVSAVRAYFRHLVLIGARAENP